MKRYDIENIQHSAMNKQEWLKYLQREAIEGFAEIERGEYVCRTADELMASIRAEVSKMKTK